MPGFSIIMPSEPSDTPDAIRGGGWPQTPFSALPSPEHGASTGNEGARAEDSAPWNEAETRALLSSLSDFVFSVRKDGVILDCHLPAETSFGLKGESVIGKRVMELLPIQI